MNASVNPSILILHYYFPTQKRNVFDSRCIARVGLEPTTFGLWDRQSDRWYISHLLKSVVRYFTATDSHQLSIRPMRPVIPTSDTFTHDHIYGRLVPSELVINCPWLPTIPSCSMNIHNSSYGEVTLCTCLVTCNHLLTEFKMLVMENVRIELTTFCLQSRCSPNWANFPKYGMQDSNLRPLESKSSTLPNWANSHLYPFRLD